MKPLKERDADLVNCIRQLKRPPGLQEKIFTCSYTLETLVNQLKTSLDNEDELKEKIQAQSKSIHALKTQLGESKSKSQLLEAQIEAMEQEIRNLSEDNQNLFKKNDFLQKQNDEIKAMSIAEVYSINQDYHHIK